MSKPGPLERHADATYEAMQAWAAQHTRSSDQFVLLDIDPARYPDQDISQHSLQGSPLEDTQMTDELAGALDPRYPSLLRATAEQKATLDQLGAALGQGQNLVLGTDHEEMMDIGLVTRALTSLLKGKGHAFENALISSKNLSFLGVQTGNGVEPLTNLFRLAFNHTYLTIPRSRTALAAGIPEEVMRPYNTQVMRAIRKRQDASQTLGQALLLGVALPGTLNKRLDATQYSADNPSPDIPVEKLDKTRVIGQASRAIMLLTRASHTLPAAVSLNPDDVRVAFGSDLWHIREDDELRAAMEEIAELQSSNRPADHYVYDAGGQLPVIAR